MKRLLTYAIPITLTACISSLSNVEKQAISERAVTDARRQPKVVHMEYLQCYALEKLDKDFCQRAIRKNINGVKEAASWEYIIPFNYEAEKLGFAAFLQDKGKKCASINEGPEFVRDKKAYAVKCAGGKNYSMRYNSENQKWVLL